MSVHAYSYNAGPESDERILVFHRIAWVTLWVSLIVYLFFNKVIQPILGEDSKKTFLLGFLVTSPSALGLFHIIYKMTCRKLWRNPVWRWLFDITTPDLNGRWIGHCITYYPNGETKRSDSIELTVLQDWRHISIGINGSLHKSDSIGASIRRVSDGWIVNYQYMAIRKLKKPSLLGSDTATIEDDSKVDFSRGRDLLAHHTHVGAARLFFPEGMDVKLIKLQFFTEHSRLGHMEFIRDESDKPDHAQSAQASEST